MRLTIVRHGESTANREGLIQGHLDAPLTELGQEQARKLGERFKTEQFDIIYASDLQRAANTAEEVAKHHGLPVKRSSLLREQSFGSLEGKRKADLSLPKNTRTAEIPIPDGETKEAMRQRVEGFFTSLSHPGKNVLIVAHGGVKMQLHHIITGEQLADTFRNTSVSIYLFENGYHRVELIDCVAHLE